MLKRQFLICLIIFVYDSSCVMENFYNIAKEMQTLYMLLNGGDSRYITGPTDIIEDASYQRSKNQIHKISQELHVIERSMNSKVIPSSETLSESNPLAMLSLDRMNLYIEKIDGDFKNFDFAVTHDQLQIIEESVFPNIVSNILIIREIITTSDRFVANNKNLILAIAHSASAKRDEICGNSQFISEVLIQIFRIVMIAEIKTNTMMGFTNKYLYQGSDASERQWFEMNSAAISQFEDYFARYVKLLRDNLEVTDNLYSRACDPDDGNWILDGNYFEFKGTMRAIIFRYTLKKCFFGTCDIIGFKPSSECDATYYAHQDGCSNIPNNCINLGSVKACTTLEHPQRLKYINSLVVGFLGNDSQCPSDDSILLDDEVDPSSVRSSCSCDCYRNSNKISLSVTKSRVELNRIITGLRFIRKNNVLLIQIREGLLGANGYINQNTNVWRPISNSIEPSEIHSIDGENRIFFLDDLRLPSKYVLTGIQFDKTTRGNLTGFEIGIFGVSFNYTTGDLNWQNQIRSSMGTDVQGEPLSFTSINPVGTVLPNKPSLGNFKYIKLQRSLLTNDFGQSTLPLFDAVPVITNPSSALNGVGIFHKSHVGFAGFISLRVYGLKYKKYFDDFTFTYIKNEKVILN